MSATEKLARLEQILNQKDENNNSLIFSNNKVYLSQRGESKSRYLGAITVSDKGKLKYSKHEEEKNIMRKNNSWSINYEILKQVDHIVYHTNERRYVIDQQSAINNGSFLHFKSSGYERKLYVPLEYWETMVKEKPDSDLTEWEKKFETLIGDRTWFNKLQDGINSDRFAKLAKWIATRRKEKKVYPETGQIFRAFRSTPFENTKVVILGQDPYPSKHANGLAFGTDYRNQIPNSLNTIFDELDRDLSFNFDLSFDTTLQTWADQGVLLLNTVLTVESGKPGSHHNMGWEEITNAAIKALNQKSEPIVFVMWGKKAQQYETMIDTDFHMVFKASHPAAEEYSQHNAGFCNNKHFSAINRFLNFNYGDSINW
jgi:uracil-DNA glycosylase